MPELTITTAETTPNAPAPVAGEGLILGKFKTQEDLQKAYVEAEKKITELGQKKPEVALSPETAKVSGVDLDAMAKEYAENNETLSPETLKKLDDAGFPKAVVDRYIAGQKAVGEKQMADLASVAGGAEGLKTVLTWARAGLTTAEAKIYNDSLARGNTDETKMILRDIVGKFFAANGRAPNLVSGETAPSGGGEAFANQQQVTEAMRDPRYKKDSAYRDKVVKMLDNSKFTVGR